MTSVGHLWLYRRFYFWFEDSKFVQQTIFKIRSMKIKSFFSSLDLCFFAPLQLLFSSRILCLDKSFTRRYVQEFFLCRFMQHMQMYQRTSYTEIIASLWLSLRLQVTPWCHFKFLTTCLTFMFSTDEFQDCSLFLCPWYSIS